MLVAGFLLASSPSASAQATGPVVESFAKSTPTKRESQDALAQVPLRFDLVAGGVEHRIDQMIRRMSLAEKIGQLVQVYPQDDKLDDELVAQIQAGEIGSIFYAGDASLVREAQRLAIEESRHGIPLLVARDVVHGFRTIFPIPLGQAATWDPELVQQAAAIAAREAESEGIDWTFAPMVDVCRDARWGRIAETLGEDPLLCGDLAAAMVRGFQQEKDGKLHGVAACAKHFVAYGLSEGGRDYNRASLSPADLHNIHLPPFRDCVDAGCRTLMTTFSEVNGIPGTAHTELIDGLLKRDWRFSGVVVSDWASVIEMVDHGYSPDEKAAAQASLMAGVDMEMCSPSFTEHMAGLVESGQVPESRIDDAVRRLLRLKVKMFEHPVQSTDATLLEPESLELARKVARQSLVLLKNDGVLPLNRDRLDSIAVIGPMADEGQQQLGCWSLDGKAEDSITPLAHLRKRLGDDVKTVHARGAKNTFAADEDMLAAAVEVAKHADVALLFVGEDAVLSGEARSRTSLDMPGIQRRLISAVAATNTPTVVVVMAGRPLTIQQEVDAANAVVYAWHPGTMAGPAVGDVLLGDVSPSGKLPVTFPRTVGQVPLYYAHSNTGRPAPDEYQPLVGSGEDDLPTEFQYRSHYLDAPLGPLFPFGFGLSYTEFEYTDIELVSSILRSSDVLGVRVHLKNTGEVAGAEVSQLYIRDRAAGLVRPVRELKAHRRTHLAPGESTVLEFAIPASELGYFDNSGQYVVEPGEFDVWVGGDSTAELGAEFAIVGSKPTKHREEIASPELGVLDGTTAR